MMTEKQTRNFWAKVEKTESMHPRAKTRNDPAYCGRTRDAA